MTQNTEKPVIAIYLPLEQRLQDIYANWYDEDTDAREYYADQQRDDPAWYEDDRDELHPNWIKP